MSQTFSLTRAARFCLASLTGAALALSAMSAASGAESNAKRSSYKVPRTVDGHPDLQGNWTNSTLTEMQRPAQYGDRLTLTDDEVHALEKATADFNEEAAKPTDPNVRIQDLPQDCGGGFSGTDCGYNSFWVDPGTQVMTINGEKRSSFIVDPVNGRVPPLTPDAQKRRAALFAAFRSGGGGMLDGPEARPLGERCIMSFGSSAGPPMLPQLYNNNYQIVQNKDTVTIVVEMVHDVRVVRLNGEHRPSHIRTWMGDSIGRWEGDTLVIETTNFRREQSFQGAGENLKVIERLTRIAPNQILYRFTIEDPTTFTKPWSGEVAFNATDQKLYEYACHEGNYALPGILAGAREQEKQKEAAQKK
jgi:hypothetical protein